MNMAMLRASVAKFAGEVDRLREEADRLHNRGWRWSVPEHRGELYGVVAGALRAGIIKATKLEGQRGDLMSYGSSGDEQPTCDADGHTVWAGRYTGFGSESMEVQVLILERASKEDTVAMLRKMADWLEEDWALLTDPRYYESEHGPGEEFHPHEPSDLPF